LWTKKIFAIRNQIHYKFNGLFGFKETTQEKEWEREKTKESAKSDSNIVLYLIQRECEEKKVKKILYFIWFK